MLLRLRLTITLAILVLLIIIAIYYYHNRPDPNFDYHNYIVLKPVIPNPIDQGGFAWHLHHAQCAIQLGKLTNKKIIIYFDKGYYYSKKNGENWWNYFFEPIGDPKIANKVVRYGDRYGYYNITSLKLPKSSNKPYLYNNTTFQKVMRPIPGDFQQIYRDNIRLNKKMLAKINNFTKKNFKNDWVIGIHYRGTDKFASYNDNEDLKHNSHFTYQFVVNKLKRHIQQLDTRKRVVIFVASDEQPFVDTIFSNFHNVISYNSSRSDINTSGLSLNSSKCIASSKTPECKELHKLQQSSIHRGKNKIAPYKKGEDAVMDIWLLSKCKELFRTHQGNFSGQPGRINPQLKVYSL